MKKSIILSIVILSMIFLTCSNPFKENEFQINYGVDGTKASLITIENAAGGTSQYSNVNLPWQKTLTRKFKKNDFVYISAMNDGKGIITVYIYKNGILFKSASSQGQIAIAEVSGSL